MSDSKPYTIHLSFSSFDAMWRYYENNLADSNIELFEGCSLDPEFSGVAPKNSIVVRHKSERRLLGGPLKAKFVGGRFVRDRKAEELHRASA